MLKSFSRYYYTLKPLRLEQVWYRLKYRLLPPAKLPKLNEASLEVNKWSFNAPFVAKQSLWPEGRVEFLNKAGSVRQPQDWNDTTHEKLWLYNLHYFDDLTAEGTEERYREQKLFIQKWINENLPMNGNGWEPYPLSLRLVNWVKWCQINQDYDPQIISSIEQQADALLKQLEFHILGNHLFANAKALVFVGCFLRGRKADHYLAKGMELIAREVPEQFLADGGHFELSPMYHCILLWDFLDLYNLSLVSERISESLPAREQQAVWREVIEKALAWLEVMCHPDGEISFFNDAAFGIAPSPQTILNYARTMGIKSSIKEKTALHTLDVSGYSRLEAGEFILMFDHAEVGPSYLPGHAHADTLSFELSVGTQRVFVNSGTSVYEIGSERARQRSTGAHNTVLINSTNSSDTWSGFRVGRRAHILAVEPVRTAGTISVKARHDGYCRAGNKLIHSRTCQLSQYKILIDDEIVGGFASAAAHFHLHPAIEVHVIDATNVELFLPNGKLLRFKSNETILVEASTWHPEFGKSVPNRRLVIAMTSSLLNCEIYYGQ